MGENKDGQVALDKPKSTKKFTPIFITIILATSIAIFVLGLASGFIYIGTKKPSQAIVIQTPICSSDASIDKLNTYLDDVTNGDQSKTKKAIEYIKNQSDYSSDPTCVEALARFYYIDRDIQGLNGQIDKLESLAKQGKYPSNRFDGLSSIYTNSINFENLTGESR